MHSSTWLWWLFTAGWVLATVGCSTPMEVHSYWGPGVRFSDTAESFQWTPNSAGPTGDGRPENPRVHDLIVQAVEKHLARKGYRKSAKQAADFWIDYRTSKATRGDAYSTDAFVEYTEGSLVLYALDPQSGKLIWRGCAQARLNQSDPPQTQAEIIDLAVEKMLDQIPSRKSAK